MAKSWFDVHKDGLAKLLQQKPKSFVIFELLQNAWDEDTTVVDISFSMIERRPVAKLVVKDDSPEGFQDISHAFTLFAESSKKTDPEKRGRFNLGEKLVLACCEKAEISTTTGTIVFNSDGTRSSKRTKTEVGSIFSALLKITRSEYEEICSEVQILIPPHSVQTIFNDEILPEREIIASFEAALPTIIADEEGNLRKTTRKTVVTIHDVLPGEAASIYEMGIPIVETGDKYHINVHQKVPMNMDRDNVTSTYLKTIRTFVLNATFNMLTEEDSTENWVQQATSDKRCDDMAFDATMDLRFGKRRVAYDPSDPEANKLAVSKGYTVISGRGLSKGQWENSRKTGTTQPAGKVTPSPKPFSKDGRKLKIVPKNEWTNEMKAIVDYATMLGQELMGIFVFITIAKDRHWAYSATYGEGELTINLSKCAGRWKDLIGNIEWWDRLLIHEFGHQYNTDHLSSGYHEALCELGAKLKQLALTKPEVFDTVTESV